MNFAIVISSRNNYVMLEHEVLRNLGSGTSLLINVDDNSDEEQVEIGIEICNKNNIPFLRNKSRGVQHAVDTAIKYIRKDNKLQSVEWIIVFQHDNWPLNENFYSVFNRFIDKREVSQFGLIGFNVLDRNYCSDAFDVVSAGGKSFGAVGLAHLSVSDRVRRVICQSRTPELMENKKWSNPFLIEIPFWASVAINISLWEKYIRPTVHYQFHLWLPDVAMQFLINNSPSVVNPELYIINDNSLKLKYGIPDNSAKGAMSGFTKFFGDYSNFAFWKRRWGWDYEDVSSVDVDLRIRYKGTLIPEYLDHDIKDGPLYTMEEYTALKAGEKKVLFGRERFPPHYQKYVGNDASEQLSRNSKEISTIVANSCKFDENPFIFEIGGGPGRNLKYISELIPSANLVSTDLNRISSMLAAEPVALNKVSFLEFDSLELVRRLRVQGIDLLVFSDHLMHLTYTAADVIIHEVANHWKPRYIIMRELRKEFENPDHPRLHHNYDYFNENYDTIFSKNSDSDPSYFIRLLHLKNDKGVL